MPDTRETLIKILDRWGLFECDRPRQDRVADDLFKHLRCDNCKHWTRICGDGNCEVATVQYGESLICDPDFFCSKFEPKA